MRTTNTGKYLLTEDDLCLYCSTPEKNEELDIFVDTKNNIFFEYFQWQNRGILFVITKDEAKKLIQKLIQKNSLTKEQIERCKNYGLI